MKTIRIISTFLFIAILISCSKVPITGRKQVNLLPESDLISMSLQQYRQIINSSKVIVGTADAQQVQTVGKKITDAVVTLLQEQGELSRIAGYQWEYKLIQENEPNAWCLPGGKIAVHTGLLPISKTEAGLAVVMGHEVAHALARHGNERMSQALLAQMGGIALSVALSQQPQQTQDIFNSAYGIGATVGLLLPFSRTQESEADKIGLILMAIAGYDPNEAIPFWQRMKDENKGMQVPEFISTHPSDEKRIEDIKAFIPEAMKYYKK